VTEEEEQKRRRRRAAFVVIAGGWLLLGPAYPHVFNGTAHSEHHPFEPMAWRMYNSVGLEMCQARFWSPENGDITGERLDRAVGKRKGHGHYGIGRKVRANDVLFTTANDLPEIARALCKSEPDRANADVRGYVRCSPSDPARWEIVTSGDRNLCP
jgi:hypothetical protein